MYTLHCRFKDWDFDLAWDAGKFTGHPGAIAILESLAEVYEEQGVAVGPPGGPLAIDDYLADPFFALWLVREKFEILSATGDVPGREPPPEGAVI